MARREGSDIQERTHGWSENTASMAEFIIYQGTYHQAPVRQPHNAPTETRAQVDEGFARFLKTHSSPTHQRVTAGGRIVPMEKRPAPPRFPLSGAKYGDFADDRKKQTTEPFPQPPKSSLSHMDTRNTGPASPCGDSTYAFDAGPSDMVNTSTVPPVDSSAGIPAFNPPHAALTSNTLFQNPGMSTEQQGLNAGPMYADVSSTLATYMPLYAPVLPWWPYQTQFLQPLLENASAPFVWDPLQSEKILLQETYDRTNEHFEMLDQQLKDLDKYRATHNREQELVAQRMVIVEQRAVAKDNMRRLHAAIKLSEGTQSSVSTMCQPGPACSIQPSQNGANRKLNVEAAAYVPKGAVQAATKASLSAKLDFPSHKPATAMEPPITITGEDVVSVEQVATDSWGNRIGHPPPSLRRKQSEMAKSMTSEPSAPSSIASQHHGCPMVSCHATEDGDNSDNGSDYSDTISTRLGRAPAMIEADYEMQLDAMRKPLGHTSFIKLSNGQLHSVEGQNLTRPPSAGMSEFERSYWSRKPDYRLHEDKENSMNSFAENFASVSQNNSGLSRNYPSPSSGTNDNPLSRQALAELSGIGINVLGSRAQEPGWDAAFKKVRAEGARHIREPTKTGNASAAETHIDPDALSNKAYSSVAVQNVHAVSSLPQSLDGAIEATLRKVQKPEGAIKKNDSPRTVFQAAGSTWYGPFRRNFFDTMFREDNISGT